MKYAEQYGNENHLNMKYISDHISTGGFTSKDCVKMTCVADVTEMVTRKESASCLVLSVPHCLRSSY